MLPWYLSWKRLMQERLSRGILLVERWDLILIQDSRIGSFDLCTGRTYCVTIWNFINENNFLDDQILHQHCSVFSYNLGELTSLNLIFYWLGHWSWRSLQKHRYKTIYLSLNLSCFLLYSLLDLMFLIYQKIIEIWI